MLTYSVASATQPNSINLVCGDEWSPTLNIKSSTMLFSDRILFKDKNKASFERLLKPSERDLGIEEVALSLNLPSKSCEWNYSSGIPLCHATLSAGAQISFSYTNSDGDRISVKRQIVAEDFNLKIDLEEERKEFVITTHVKMNLSTKLNNSEADYKVKTTVGTISPTTYNPTCLVKE